jgi:hypothetical protein
MFTFSNVMRTGTAYQMYQNFISFVRITSSAACLSLFHQFLFFAVLIDTSATPASVSCNSETIGDNPARVF